MGDGDDRAFVTAQVLLEPRQNVAEIFEASNFSLLAELIYLQRTLRREGIQVVLRGDPAFEFETQVFDRVIGEQFLKIRSGSLGDRFREDHDESLGAVLRESWSGLGGR